MPTVMVVEDCEDIREVVAETVRDEGYDVLEAEFADLPPSDQARSRDSS
jgi:CheY-like chemotaxis protein